MFNMDFSKKLVIETESLDWIASPAIGVWRKPLEREEKESGHTTSIVKYDPESSFSSGLRQTPLAGLATQSSVSVSITSLFEKSILNIMATLLLLSF